MAKYTEGINGPFSGKIGKVVGSSWKGINYMKGLPDFTSTIPTEGQLGQRNKLGMVSSWLKPMKAVIDIGYQSAIAKTPMNAAVSLVMKTALSGEGVNLEIDFSRVVFSKGELLASWIEEVLVVPAEGLHIKWRNAAASLFCSGDDRATFICYHPGSRTFFTFKDLAFRSDQGVMLTLPLAILADTLHCWMHHVNQKGDAVSTGIYISI